MKKEIDKLAWLCIYNNKLLTARSKNKNLFYIPGGKREIGESDADALIREIKEEISVDLTPDSIKYAATLIAQADEKETGITVRLTCYFADYVGNIHPDAEIEEVRFLSYIEKNNTSFASKQVMDWLKDKKFID